jgi:hypothetical protein
MLESLGRVLRDEVLDQLDLPPVVARDWRKRVRAERGRHVDGAHDPSAAGMGAALARLAARFEATLGPGSPFLSACFTMAR